MLDDGNQAIRDDGSCYLNSDGIFRTSPKCFDFEALFGLFEKQFNLPSILIQVSHLKRGQMEGISQKYELTILLFIEIFDWPLTVWPDFFENQSVDSKNSH